MRQEQSQNSAELQHEIIIQLQNYLPLSEFEISILFSPILHTNQQNIIDLDLLVFNVNLDKHEI